MHDISDNEDDRMSLSDSEKREELNDDENQANDDKNAVGRRVDPATSMKKIIRRTVPKLNPARLTGPKGITTIETYFTGFKFHGKGREKEDLDRIMKRLEHWAHRLFPKYEFDDFLEKVESLGAKKEIRLHLTKYRRDMLPSDSGMQEDNEAEEPREKPPEPIDEFDMLIAEQIAERAKGSTQSQPSKSFPSQPATQLPAGTSPALKPSARIDEELKHKIERNRQIALEKRLAKIREREKNDERGLQNAIEILDDVISQIIEDTPEEVAESIEEKNDQDEIKKRIERNRQIALQRRLAKMKEKENAMNMEESQPLNIEARSTEVEDNEANPMEVESQNSSIEETLDTPISQISTSGIKETITSTALLTDAELDMEIGNAVEMFTKSHR